MTGLVIRQVVHNFNPLSIFSLKICKSYFKIFLSYKCLDIFTSKPQQAESFGRNLTNPELYVNVRKCQGQTVVKAATSSQPRNKQNSATIAKARKIMTFNCRLIFSQNAHFKEVHSQVRRLYKGYDLNQKKSNYASVLMKRYLRLIERCVKQMMQQMGQPTIQRYIVSIK